MNFGGGNGSKRTKQQGERAGLIFLLAAGAGRKLLSVRLLSSKQRCPPIGGPRRRRRRASKKPLYPGFCGAISGHRYYNPSTGRWLSRDPLADRSFRTSLKLGSKDGPSLNLYSFVDNNPLTRVDLLGLKLVDTGVQKCNEGAKDWWHDYLVVNGQSCGLYPRLIDKFDKICCPIIGPGKVDQDDDKAGPGCREYQLDDEKYDVPKLNKCVADTANAALGKQQPYSFFVYNCRIWRNEVIEQCKAAADKTPRDSLPYPGY